MTWRMAAMCADCPFAKKGPGLRLRRSLHRGRWAEIIYWLKHDQHFTCHKTADDTGDGTNLICAGSIEWQEAHGYAPSQLFRIMERLDWIYERRSEKIPPSQREGA